MKSCSTNESVLLSYIISTYVDKVYTQQIKQLIWFLFLRCVKMAMPYYKIWKLLVPIISDKENQPAQSYDSSFAFLYSLLPAAAGPLELLCRLVGGGARL